MVTTRRTVNGTSQAQSFEAKNAGTRAMPARVPSGSIAALPTRTEAILLFIYPATLLLGSLFSHFSPSLRPPTNASIYSPLHQSFQPQEAAPSYFAQKRNVFNVYFVKLGWFWCTLALGLFTGLVGRGRFAAAPHLDPGANALFTVWRGGNARILRMAQVLARWAVATFVWTLTTQWCFGPPIIDRGFSLTGGACFAGIEDINKKQLSGGANPAKLEIEKVLTHAACTAAGGRWTGGWDISGHVFLLVLGSGMLWFEILPFIRRWSSRLGVDYRLVKREDGSTVTALEQYGPQLQREVLAEGRNGSLRRHSMIPYQIRAYALTFTLGIAVLSWWMLLMTAAFFHTWFEKLMGCVVAFVGLWITYYLPRAVTIIRAVVGMPGL